MSLGGVGFYSLTTTVAPGAGTKIGAHEVTISGQKVYYQGVVVGYIQGTSFVPVDPSNPMPVALSGNLIKNDFDYIKATYPNPTTEIYTYKQGGASGTTVATVEVVFQDTEKNILDTLTRY